MSLPERHRTGLAPADRDAVERESFDAVFSAAYQELRRLAAAVRRNGAPETLSPTALVNEAYLKLSATPALAHTTPTHFRRIAARAMRQVLVEAARRRQADKRGGGAQQPITLDEQLHTSADPAGELLAIDDALDALAAISERQARVVELRYFAGLEVLEVADELGISEATVMRDWRVARAWLAARLAREL
jgi:RNA polymerase sigma-70 factor, ECF subfamily